MTDTPHEFPTDRNATSDTASDTASDTPAQTIVSPAGHDPLVDPPRVLRDRIVSFRDKPYAPQYVVALHEAPGSAEPAFASSSDDLLDAQLYTEDEAQRVAAVVAREYAGHDVAVTPLASVIAEAQAVAREHGQPTVLDALLGIGEASHVPAEFTPFEVRASRIADRVLRAIIDPDGIYPDAATMRRMMDEGDAARVAAAEGEIVMELRGGVKDMLVWRREVEGEAVGRLATRFVQLYDDATRTAIGKAILESPSLAQASADHVHRTMQTARAFAGLFAELVRSETDVAQDVERHRPAEGAVPNAEYQYAVAYLAAIRDCMLVVAQMAALIGIPLSRDGSATLRPAGVQDVTPGTTPATPTVGTASTIDATDADPLAGQRTE